MKTIIIPTDFSPVAVNAMHYGIEMAMAIKADIVLLNVFQYPVSLSEVPAVVVPADELQKNAETKMQSLKQQVNHIVAGSKSTVTTDTRMGDLTEELKDICNKTQPFAIVMGTRGESGIEHIIFGSSALSVVRHITWPVITVPPGKTFGTGIKKIGLASDFKDVIITTPVGVIRDFINVFDAGLHVLNVENEDHSKTAEADEQTMLLHSMLKDMNPVYDYIHHKDVETGISEFAEKNNFDLIVVIPKKHKLLEGIFKKSSTKQFVFQSHIPVMCVQAD